MFPEKKDDILSSSLNKIEHKTEKRQFVTLVKYVQVLIIKQMGVSKRRQLPQKMDVTKLMHIRGVPLHETGHDPQT
jgi:hypothetical protein